ncbi:hypothetical protein [Streptomyces sioyaensis]|uniref:hypothetical protein n=1 Tax=Streptomyces sioyaensis TaxID=67364 RepID=UPI003D74A162
MEQPMSGPEPEAPAPAGPGEPEERVEAEDGGAGEAAGAGAAGPAGPQPIGVGVTPTGQPAVDARLRRLADADHLPADGHLPVYEDVHRGLRDVLAALDQHPGPPAPSSTFSTPHDNRS